MFLFIYIREHVIIIVREWGSLSESSYHLTVIQGLTTEMKNGKKMKCSDVKLVVDANGTFRMEKERDGSLYSRVAINRLPKKKEQ